MPSLSFPKSTRLLPQFSLPSTAALNGFGKRTFDVLFSLAVLLMLSPVFLLIAVLIKLFSPEGPVFFAHHRLGQYGQLFPCYKFRSMVPDADKRLAALLKDPVVAAEFAVDFKLKNDPRIIPVVGPILRKASLDELPQFFNALLGHMSVIGPRPIVLDECDKYGVHLERMLSVKPGISGLWQVSGRNDTSYATRVSMDVHYARNNNVLWDIELVLRTLQVMVSGRGAY